MDYEYRLENEGDPRKPRSDLALDNWKLILIFFVGLVICVIFFTAGLIVGRHQPRVTDPDLASMQVPERVPEPSQPQTRAVTDKASLTEKTETPRETIVPVQTHEDPLIQAETEQSAASQPAPQANQISQRRPAASGFRVQIAAMRSMREAQAIVNKLKQEGFDAFVVPPGDPGDVYYRVQMGDYTDRARAQEVILQLRAIGEKPVLKRN